jgi:chromate transporter
MIYFQLLLTFAKIGLFAFGGGSATIPLIQNEIVNGLHWLSLNEFLQLIAIAELTPGPIAVNSATFVGYKLGGVGGAAIATIGVCLPSIILVLIAMMFLQKFATNLWTERVVKGLRPAVIALIAAAAYSIADGGIADIKGIVIAVVSFSVLLTRKLNPILVLVLAGVAGIIVYL